MSQQKVVRFFTALNKEGIQYCHWKSNAHLAESFASETDFDLLVAAHDTARFDLCAGKFGLKRRYATADKVYPGMEDYLGFDKTYGKMFHLHVHYKLVFGKKYQKNYRLPLEQQMLNTSVWDINYPIRVVRPELELILLIFRSILKMDLGIKTAAKLMLKRNVFPSNIREEYDFLIKRFNQESFHNLSRQLFPDLFDVLERMSLGDLQNISYFQLVVYQRKIKKSLKPFRLFQNSDLKREVRIKRLSSQNSRNWLGPGGIAIAFVGADGSGKSSTVSHITNWLGWKLSVEAAYMGIPKNNLQLAILKITTRVCNKLQLRFLRHWLNCLKWIYVAKSRCKIFNRSEVLKNQGRIIIFDRFPLSEFWDMEEPMDGPRLIGLNGWEKREQNIYNAMKRPDHIFILKVDEEESSRRKDENKDPETRLLISKKIKAVNKLIDSKDNPYIVIDTLKGQEEVLLEIKKKIWGLL